MRILSQDSQFAIQLPDNFFPQEIEDQFSSFLKNYRAGYYQTVRDYMNAQIRSLEVPGFSYTPETQDILYGKKEGYQPAKPDQELISRQMTIKLKDVDSYGAYYIALKIWQHHYFNNNVGNQFIGPVNLYNLDQNGDAVFRIRFRRCLMTGISGNNYAFATQQVADKSFTWNIYYNWMDVDYLIVDDIPQPDPQLLLQQTFPLSYE